MHNYMSIACYQVHCVNVSSVIWNLKVTILWLWNTRSDCDSGRVTVCSQHIVQINQMIPAFMSRFQSSSPYPLIFCISRSCPCAGRLWGASMAWAWLALLPALPPYLLVHCLCPLCLLPPSQSITFAACGLICYIYFLSQARCWCPHSHWPVVGG